MGVNYKSLDGLKSGAQAPLPPQQSLSSLETS